MVLEKFVTKYSGYLTVRDCGYAKIEPPRISQPKAADGTAPEVYKRLTPA
jgi:hypothetical protein